MLEIDRRELIKSGAVAGGAGLAGCLSNAGEPQKSGAGTPTEGNLKTHADVFDDGWYQRPKGDPENVPDELECSDEGANRLCEDAKESGAYEDMDCDEQHVTRRRQSFDEESVSWGGGMEENWMMAVDGKTFQPGEEVNIQMRNVSAGAQNYSAKSKYNLQVYTDAGWEDVRVVGGWTPGSGGRVPHDDHRDGKPPGESVDWTLELDEDDPQYCPGFSEGRYRFAFYGFNEEDAADVIAVGWDVES